MSSKLKAIIFMLLSGLSFALMACFIKLAQGIPVFEKLLFRNLIAFMIAFINIKKNKIPVFGHKANQKYLITRTITGFLGTVLFFYAVSNIYIADASMLHKISPFFVTLFAGIFLKEKISKIQYPALIFIFIASLLIIKPKFDLSILPSLSAIGAAVLSGVSYTMLRYLGDKEHPATVVFYFSFFSTIIVIPLAITVFVMPTPLQWIYLIATGLAAAAGQLFMTYSYKLEKASEVVVFSYSNIIFAAIIGLFLGEYLDIWSILGGIIIIGISIFLFYYNKKNNIETANEKK